MSKRLYEVIITPFAESAMQDCVDYLRFELFSDQAADNWLDMMERAVNDIAFLPVKYPLVDREPWHSSGVRFYVVKGYIIYFWISDEKKIVYLIDVIHQRMDQDKRLFTSVQDFELNTDK